MSRHYRVKILSDKRASRVPSGINCFNSREIDHKAADELVDGVLLHSAFARTRHGPRARTRSGYAHPHRRLVNANILIILSN